MRMLLLLGFCGICLDRVGGEIELGPGAMADGHLPRMERRGISAPEIFGRGWILRYAAIRRNIRHAREARVRYQAARMIRARVESGPTKSTAGQKRKDPAVYPWATDTSKEDMVPR